MLFEGNKARRFVRQKICALSPCLLTAHWCPEFCLITAVSNTAGVNNRTPHLPCLPLSLYLSSPNAHINSVTSHSLRTANHTHSPTEGQEKATNKVLLNGGRRRRALEKPTLLKKSPGRGAQEEYSLGPSVCYEGLAHSRGIMGNQICSSFPYQFTFSPPLFISFPLSFALVKTLCYVWTTNLNCRLDIEWFCPIFAETLTPITLLFSSLNKKSHQSRAAEEINDQKKKTKIQIKMADFIQVFSYSCTHQKMPFLGHCETHRFWRPVAMVVRWGRGCCLRGRRQGRVTAAPHQQRCVWAEKEGDRRVSRLFARIVTNVFYLANCCKDVKLSLIWGSLQIYMMKKRTS